MVATDLQKDLRTVTNERNTDAACDAWERENGDKLPGGLREGLKEIGDLIGEEFIAPGAIAFARVVWIMALLHDEPPDEN